MIMEIEEMTGFDNRQSYRRENSDKIMVSKDIEWEV